MTASIATGGSWRTNHTDLSTTIHTRSFCPEPGCDHRPHLATNYEGTEAGNLENLPEEASIS